MIKVVFWGTPQFAVPSLERLLEDAKFEVLGVVTQPDRRRGRGSQLVPSPVKSVALAHNLQVWQPQKVKHDPEVLAQLRSLSADVFVVVAYGQILSPQILEMPRWGCINSHGSLLPRYRGAAPIQWALYHGELETGITTIQMDAGMDTGDMLLKAKIAIAPLENAQDLAQKLAVLSADLLVETLLKLAQQDIQPIPQDPEQATYAPLIKKSDYQLDWSKPAIALHNQIRGFSPNCVTQLRAKPLKILATVPLDRMDDSVLPPSFHGIMAQVAAMDARVQSPGTIIHIAKQVGPIVQTGDGVLLLHSVQLAGKRQQSGWDFANGVRLKVGDILEQRA